MSLQHQHNFLARLYTDAEFRRAFLSAPEKIGAENDLNNQEIAEIAEIMPEELNFFADSLFWKRRRAVEKFLPLTKKLLQNDFEVLFREFSQNFNPQTVEKHFEDALEFSKFLQNQKVSQIAQNVAKFEHSKLEFFGNGKRFAYCKLDFDVREIHRKDTQTLKLSLKKRRTIAVWLRTGKKIKYFLI